MEADPAALEQAYAQAPIAMARPIRHLRGALLAKSVAYPPLRRLLSTCLSDGTGAS